MNSKLNRRSFLAASVAVSAASTALLAPHGLMNLLASADATSQVFAILQEYLQLTSAHAAVAAAFTKSLQTGQDHLKSGVEFAAGLGGKVDRGEVEMYVVQEFIGSTNYLAFSQGLAAELTMLPEVKTQPAATLSV